MDCKIKYSCKWCKRQLCHCQFYEQKKLSEYAVCIDCEHEMALWLEEQRRALKSGKLTKQQIEKLDSIDKSWRDPQ
jgi:hypothetical protein